MHTTHSGTLGTHSLPVVFIRHLHPVLRTHSPRLRRAKPPSQPLCNFDVSTHCNTPLQNILERAKLLMARRVCVTEVYNMR